MKKIKFNLAVIAIVFISISLFADDVDTKGTENKKHVIVAYGGVASTGGGATFSTAESVGLFSYGNLNEFSSVELQLSTAYQFGLTYDFFILKKLSITTGVAYVNKPFGLIYLKDQASKDLTFTLDINYLEIPFGIRYNWKYVFVGIGGYYGFKMSEEVIVSDEDEFPKENTDEIEANDDYGMFFDFGLTFDIGNISRLTVFTRYESGLAVIYDDADGYPIKNIENLSSWQLNFGYGIRL